MILHAFSGYVYFFFPLKMEVICQGEGPRMGLCLGQQTQLWLESMWLGGKVQRRAQSPVVVFFFLSSFPCSG